MEIVKLYYTIQEIADELHLTHNVVRDWVTEYKIDFNMRSKKTAQRVTLKERAYLHLISHLRNVELYSTKGTHRQLDTRLTYWQKLQRDGLLIS